MSGFCGRQNDGVPKTSTSAGKKDCANVLKVEDLKMGRVPEHPGGLSLITPIP